MDDPRSEESPESRKGVQIEDIEGTVLDNLAPSGRALAQRLFGSRRPSEQGSEGLPGEGPGDGAVG